MSEATNRRLFPAGPACDHAVLPMDHADDQTQPRPGPQLESVGMIEAPPLPEPSRGGRKVWFGVAVGVVVLGGIAFGVLGHHKQEAAPLTRDVPTRDGELIVFSNAYAQRAGIKTTVVKRAPLVPTIRVVGTVSFDPSRVAAVGTRLRAVVRRTSKFEGDEVKAGDILAELDSAELGEAQANLITNKVQTETAQVNAQRERSLLDQQLTTAREAEIAETTARSQAAMLSASEQRVRALGGGGAGALGATVLRSPIAGHVVGRFVEPGQAVEANITAYKIADLSRLWIELAVTETSLTAVRMTDKVSVAPVSDPSKAIEGKVAHVGEVIDLSTRTADVRVEVDNTQHVLRVGQSVFATIEATGPAHEALLIPRDAVVFVDGKSTVFRAEADTKVVPVVVKLGAANETDYEVLEGLKDGAKVVCNGAFYLKSELFR